MNMTGLDFWRKSRRRQQANIASKLQRLLESWTTVIMANTKPYAVVGLWNDVCVEHYRKLLFGDVLRSQLIKLLFGFWVLGLPEKMFCGCFVVCSGRDFFVHVCCVS